MEPDDYEPLVAYLAEVAGMSCTSPFDRIQDWMRATRPVAATSPGWWTAPDGWDATAASAACLAAGWRLKSVHPGAGLVRFVRVDRDGGPAAKSVVRLPPRKSGR